MNNGRYRLLLLCSHPTQYAPPVFRRMVAHPKLDILVAYCSLQGADRAVDPGFGVEVAWDLPVLEGYPWVQVPNRSPVPRIERFFGLINPGLWTMVRQGGFDAVIAYLGYAYASFWIALAAAKLRGIPIIFGTDASNIQPRDGKSWKIPVKKFLLPKIYGLAGAVYVGSAAGRKYLHSLGVPDEKIVLAPFTVDNEWWRARATEVDRAAVRRAWQIPEDAPVVLFCAKLQPWKRPQDVLRAFAKGGVAGAQLVFAGDGPLRKELEAEAQELGLADNVRFLGFVNQSRLPEVYRAADLFVLSSEFEPFGVVVNEAMLCGCAVAVSDRVGAASSLVQPGENGFVFARGDVEALASIFREILSNRERLRQMGEAACKRMEMWSPRENIESVVQAVTQALHNKNARTAEVLP